MILTEEQIAEINRKVHYRQGIFFQPNGVPVTIKEKVIYLAWVRGGQDGGWYDMDSDDEYYDIEPEDEPEWQALEEVLAILKPTITMLEMKKLLRELVRTDDYSDNLYYGNFKNYNVKFIILSELYKFLSR